MNIVKASEAYNILGHDTYSKNIEEMCKITYVFWYDNYYKTQIDKYPNWKSLYDIYMSIANGKELHKYIGGYVAIDKNKIIGYCSLNYNDYLLDENMNKYDTLWICDVFVYPEYRGKGVAQKLIEIAKKYSNNITNKLYLACETHLINFYKKNDFILIKPKTHLSDFWNIMIYEKK